MSNDPAALTVMTLNIWNVNEWESRRDAIVAWVDEVQPDVLALQEVNRTEELCQATWIAERTGMIATFGKAADRASGEFGNAVLTSLPVLDSRIDTLTDAGSGNQPRGMTTVVVSVAGRQTSVSSTHLSYLFQEGWVRERQVRDIAAIVAEVSADTAEGFPPIVCGDFNATPESTEIRFLKGLHAFDGQSFHMFDAFDVANPGELGFTWTNANPFAAKAMTPDFRIDYVFVGVRAADGAGRVLSAGVVCDAPRRGAWPSDHVGVVAQLAMP